MSKQETETRFSKDGVLKSTCVRIGLAIWILGCGPLVLVLIVGALLGNSSNPVILGIMAGLSAPAGLLFVVIGAFLYFIRGGEP